MADQGIIQALFGGPSWLDRANQERLKAQAAYLQGGPSAMMADTQGIQDLAGGFGGTTLKYQPLKGAMPSEAGYVYHATNAERAADIIESGKLKTHKPYEFTDQSVWPDNSTEKRNYFTPTAQNTWQFAPEEGAPVLLRVSKTSHPFKTESTGDIYSTKPVDASNIEALTETGWQPLKSK